ncbi:peptidase inhibitor family I36 protein [Streptomyces sp. NBC_00151]|uniref:peptidase inhibitor family I36 protein n=1 Tax=Streptomyces sp. NBC_00151 TaxID=2975669 RepID=UPI003FA38A2A
MGGTAVAGATPASATGGCPSDRLCVYDLTSFGGNRITSTSTNSCFLTVSNSYEFNHYVESYVNNLPVDAHLWEFDDSAGWIKVRTLVSGGFSTRIPVNTATAVCEGKADPNN